MYPRSAGPSRMQLRGGRTARGAGGTEALPRACGDCAARGCGAAAGLHDAGDVYRGTRVGQVYGGAKAHAAQAASGAVRAQAYVWSGRDDVDFYFDVERSVGADDDEVRGVHSAVELGGLMLCGGLHTLQNYTRRTGALSSFSQRKNRKMVKFLSGGAHEADRRRQPPVYQVATTAPDAPALRRAPTRFYTRLPRRRVPPRGRGWRMGPYFFRIQTNCCNFAP